MEARTATRPGQDSFLDALHSEILAGTEILSAWVAYVQSRGKIELLFEFEAWLRGLSAFFDLKNTPLSEGERNNLIHRSFAGEVRVASQALQECDRCALGLRGLGQDARVEFEAMVETQIYKGSFRDSQVIRALEQTTPVDSLARFIESAGDIMMMMDTVQGRETCDARSFLSIGRMFQREVRNCRYLGMLLGQQLRLQYDRVDNPALSAVLKSIPDEHLRRKLALVLLHFFRCLQYLKFVALALSEDRPLRRYIVVFSLLNEQASVLIDFLKSRFLRGRSANAELRNAIEVILHSLDMDLQRVMQRELFQIAHESHPSVIYTRIENCHGLLRTCYQSNVVTLVQAFDSSLDSKAVFPSLLESLHNSQQLYKDLRTLRQDMNAYLENKSGVDLNGVLDRITRFQETSMRLLMYQDWGTFEEFAASLITASGQDEIHTLLGRFTNFLDTLTEEVAKRSALK